MRGVVEGENGLQTGKLNNLRIIKEFYKYDIISLVTCIRTHVHVGSGEGPETSGVTMPTSPQAPHTYMYFTLLLSFTKNVLTWAESLGPNCDPHMTTLATTK